MLNVHKELKNLSTKQIKDYCRSQSFPYAICSLSILGDLNVGNMMRTSNIFGVRKFILFGRKQYDSRSAVGSQHYLDIQKELGVKNTHQHNFKNVLELKNVELDADLFVKVMNDNNFVPVFVEQYKDAKILDEINWNEQLVNIRENKIFCFVFGNETTGIPKNIIETKEQFEGSFVLMIRQFGCIKSFNVSTSCALVSYEISKFFKHKFLLK